MHTRYIGMWDIELFRITFVKREVVTHHWTNYVLPQDHVTDLVEDRRL